MAEKSPKIPTIFEVKDKHETDWLKVPGVSGVGIGQQSRGSGLAIHVYVERITPALRSSIPTEVDGHLIELEATGEFKAQ